MFETYTKVRCAVAGLITAVILVLGSSPAYALNVISLDPAVQSVEVGSEFMVDLMMDFDDVTVGGGVEITLDPLLTFLSFDFDPAFTANFGLTGPLAGETVQPLEIGFGWFLLTPVGGATGTYTVGQLTFRAEASSASQVISTAGSALTPGPFFGPGSGTPMSVQFGQASVTISSPAATGGDPAGTAPEPGPALMLGLGLTGLAFVRRPKHTPQRS
jgi:hypothetical protein